MLKNLALKNLALKNLVLRDERFSNSSRSILTLEIIHPNHNQRIDFMQPAHQPSRASAQPATNWRYTGSATLLPSMPGPRCLTHARATNWRYGALANNVACPIVPPLSLKAFAVNWRYQISVG